MTGAIHSCIFFTVDVLLGRSSHFIVSLSARPFSGLVGEADPPPVCFLEIMARSASNHYYFLKGVSQHLWYLLALDSQPCPIWTIAWGVLSVLEGPFIFRCLQSLRKGFQSGQWIFWLCLQRFLKGGSRGFSKLVGCIRASWICLSLPISLGVIRSVFSASDHLTARLAVLYLGGLACPSVHSWWQGLRNYRMYCLSPDWGILYLTSLYHGGEGLDGLIGHTQRFSIFLGVIQSSCKDCSVTASDVPRSLRLSFRFPHLMMEKDLMRCPLLSGGVFLRPISSCSVRRRR